MKAFHSLSRFLIAAALLGLPALACAGPDDAPRRTATTRVSTRPAPPDVTVQGSITTTTTTEEDDRPIQPLRQREESVCYRIAYKLLNDLGFTGTEGDRQPVGYQQIYGPPPMLVYHRPPAPHPRRFPHFAPAEEHGSKPPAEPPKAKPDAEHGPESGPVLPAAAKPTPDEAAEPSVLPDASQSAARSRDEEILSYFRRPGPSNVPQNGNPGAANGPVPPDAGDQGYLQAPQQLPIPPSRATYRVVPK